MKITIPDELKADLPQTSYGKMLSATPVVMTVIATMLAGLASSEMTRAQYFRSFAAQMQSKAGDQWSFFQAKRLRGAMQQNTLDMLRATAEPGTIDGPTIDSFLAKLNNANSAKSADGAIKRLDPAFREQLLSALQKGLLPTLPASPPVDNSMKAALTAVETSAPESEIATLLASVSEKSIDDALLAARSQVQLLDTALRPLSQAVELIDRQIEHPKPMESAARNSISTQARDFMACRLRYAASRYEAEARLNQAIAGFYELKVRKGNLEAQRHHARSQRFFFGMLISQAAVIISTFAIAARKRNLLWSLAAAAGLIAIGFAIWVYLYV